jgi:hypothetical protein
MDTVLGLFSLLKDEHTERNLVLAGRAAVQRILAGTKIAPIAEIDPVLSAFAVAY